MVQSRSARLCSVHTRLVRFGPIHCHCLLPLVWLVLVGLMVGLARPAWSAGPDEVGRWPDMRKAFFADGEAMFDARVRVELPGSAEDAMNVPVAVDARALPAGSVERIIVVADFNPILKVLEFEPGALAPYIAFRMKVQQTTPVRAGVKLKDGRWLVGSAVVSSAGGGCTAPSVGRGVAGWERTLNQVSARQFSSASGARLRFSVLHPMDTGLAPGIPAFYLDELNIRDATGAVVARILPAEPVSENPVFTLDAPGGLTGLLIDGRDNNGNRVTGAI